MKLRVLALACVAAASFLHCAGDDYTPPTLTFDGFASRRDASDADGLAELETGADAQVDPSARPDAAEAGIDAGGDADAAVAETCPVLAGDLPDPAAAGIPTFGLALWLRADRGLQTLPGGAVCRWDDLSGKGQAFAPATATPPTLVAAGLKNRPAVSFSGAGQHLSRNGVLGIAPNAGRTIAVIGATADTTRRFQYFFQGLPGSDGTYVGIDANTAGSAGSLEGVYVTNNGYDANVATSMAPRTHVLSIASLEPGGVLPGVLAYVVDGVAVTLTRTPVGAGAGVVESFAPATSTLVGQAAPGFTGAVLGEMLVYDRALSEPERLAVEQYFTARFP